MEEMSYKQVVGARYVPKFYQNSQDPTSSEWESGVAYEPLTNVTYQMNGYCSKKPVPVGIGSPATNPAYWAKTFDYNAAYAGLQEEITAIKEGGLDDKSLILDKLSDETVARLIDNSKIIFMPVGDTGGNCTVIVTEPLKKVVMLDTGYTDIYTEIKAEMGKNNISHIDYFFLSHYHHDHFDNLANLISDGFIDSETTVYIPIATEVASGWNTNRTLVISTLGDIPYHEYNSAETVTVDKFLFEFFNCDEADYAYYRSQSIDDGNVYCVCTYVSCGEFKLLMTADCTGEGLTHNANKFTKVDVLQIPHHGYRSGESDMILYLATDPKEGVVFMPKSFYESESDYLRTSTRLQYFDELNHPFYMMGFGAVYCGVSENEYCLVPNSKRIFADTCANPIPFYVDNSYTGESDGSNIKPFKTIQQAIAIASKIINCSQVQIHVVGDYNKPDETITLRNMPCSISITGENLTPLKLNIGRCVISNSNVEIKYAHFADTTNTGGTVAISSNAYCHLDHCIIDGDKTGASSIANGRQLSASNNSFFEITSCTVSKGRCALFVREGASANVYGMDGVSNENLFAGINGGIIVGANVTAAYTSRLYAYGAAATRKPFISLQVGGEGYCSNAPYTMYHGEGGGTTTTKVLSLSAATLENAIVRVMSSNGAIYQVNKDGSTYSTPALVQNATDASHDTDFAVSMSGSDMTITFSKNVKVIVF